MIKNITWINKLQKVILNRIKKIAPQLLLYLACLFVSYVSLREIDMVNKIAWTAVLLWMFMRSIQDLQKQLKSADKKIIYLETEDKLSKTQFR